MNYVLPRARARLLVLALLTAGVLALGASGSAWATPSQRPGGQTIVTRTPGQLESPTPTSTPRRRSPTRTPTPTRTATPGPGTATSTPANAATATAQAGTATAQGATATVQAATATAQVGTATAQAGAPQPGAFPCVTRPSDPPNDAPRVIREVVNGQTVLTMLNCPWSLRITAGDLGQAATFELKLVGLGASFPPNAGERFFGPHIELTLFDANGNPISSPTFAQPVELCFNYTAAEAAAIGDARQFVIELYNPATRTWERLTSTLDAANRLICTQLPHLSRYALAARVPLPSALPNTGAAGGALVPGWLWLLLAVLLGAGASLWARHGRAPVAVRVERER